MVRLGEAGCPFFVALAFDHEADRVGGKPEDIWTETVILFWPFGVEAEEVTESFQGLLQLVAGSSWREVADGLLKSLQVSIRQSELRNLGDDRFRLASYMCDRH